MFEDLREKTKEKLKKELSLEDDITDLEQLILRLYYDPKDTDGKKTHEIIFGKEINDKAEIEEEETD